MVEFYYRVMKNSDFALKLKEEEYSESGSGSGSDLELGSGSGDGLDAATSLEDEELLNDETPNENTTQDAEL